MSKNDDSLFLLEVLIDKIVFVKSPCFSDKDFRTCVNIDCPAVQTLEICDDDPGTCIARSGGPFIKTFNSGKSCLFSLKESEISAAMTKYPVKVSVYKSLPCGCLPTKIIMGEATIDMTKEFVQTRNKYLEDQTNVSYQALKDSFRIVGPDGVEAGEVVMFLRISCFGKLIVTRFQGTGGSPNVGASGSNAVVDRSCAPKRDFQTAKNPCVCGAARTGSGRLGPDSNRQSCVTGGKVCQSARDPYNSMPCQDPDEPCFCSGPMPSSKQNMVCRNTDQYCLHIPKGPSSSEHQELSEHLTAKLPRHYPEEQCFSDYTKTVVTKLYTPSRIIIADLLHSLFNKAIIDFTDKFKNAPSIIPLSHCHVNLDAAKHAKLRTSSLIGLSQSESSICSVVDFYKSGVFGRNETEVYMNIFNEIHQNRASGTQATAFINKCLQVNTEICPRYGASTLDTNSNRTSTCTMSTLPSRQSQRRQMGSSQYHDVYFFGRKKGAAKSTGMGSKESYSKLHKTGQSSNTATKSDIDKSKMKGGYSNTVSSCSTSSVQTKSTKSASTATNTIKAVSIKEDKPKKPCPAIGTTKGDMTATVSHIKLGPREPCPVHGKEPCQGPKCIIASSGAEQAPVKVTTVTNPRRSVFELVIRKMTGAPLAKNELMLEWTPPPSRLPPCGGPCPIPCTVPIPYRPSKCKMIVCRPSPCKPKCFKKPCSLNPCKSRCKKFCKTCCSKKCTPCGRPPCTVTCLRECAPACCKTPCSSPCKSSPCLRLCPVGRKRARKARSQPKIRENKKQTSPCLNRSKTCPVVRCRSMPAPCIGCCSLPPCPPRQCCSVSPCKPPKCGKSGCFVCCI